MTEEPASVTIPYPLLSIVVVLVVQTMGGIWWASAMNAKMGYLQGGQEKLEIAINLGTKDRYTLLDAQRDWTVNDRRMDALEHGLESNKKAIIDLEIQSKTIRQSN